MEDVFIHLIIVMSYTMYIYCLKYARIRVSVASVFPYKNKILDCDFLRENRVCECRPLAYFIKRYIYNPMKLADFLERVPHDSAWIMSQMR